MSVRNDNDIKTILLVEDEALIAMNEASMLTKRGYAVLTAYNAEKAVQTVEQNGVDLILMDIDLGVGKADGTRAAERILEKHDLPIVFLTSHAEEEYVEKVKKITGYGYVLKNTGEFVLIESINMAFNLFEANQKTKNDLLEKKKAEAALKEGKEKIKFLADTAFELIDRNVDGDIYDYIGRCLHRLNPESYIGINSIDYNKGLVKTEALFGFGSKLNEVSSLLGHNPVGKSYRFDDVLSDLSKATVERLKSGGIHTLTLGEMPESTSREIEKTLNIEQIYTLGFRVDQKLYATAFFLCPAGIDIQHVETVEAFARQASIALKRQHIEYQLRRNRQHLQLFIDSSPDFYFLKDTELTYLLCNAANARFFGMEVSGVIGKTDFDLMPEYAAKECAKSDRLAMTRKEMVINVEEVNGRSYETRKMPVIERNQVVGVAGIVRDIIGRPDAP